MPKPSQLQSLTSKALLEKLYRKLGWTRKLWLAVCTVLQESRQSIIGVEKSDPARFEMCSYHKQLQDLEVYQILYDDSDSDSESERTACEIEEDLLNGALTLGTCSTAMYILWDKVNEALKDDPDIIRIEWMRKILRPSRVFVPSNLNGQVPFYNHDYFLIHCNGGVRIVLDVSGDQFGLRRWLYNAEEYKGFIEFKLLQPPLPVVDREIQVLNEQEPNLPYFKASVEKLIEKCEEEWAQNGQTRVTMEGTPDAELEKIFDGLAARIQDRLMPELMAAITGDCTDSDG